MTKLSRQRLVEVDLIASRYGVLPSTLLDLSCDDFQFNLLVIEKALEAEAKAAKASVQKRGR